MSTKHFCDFCGKELTNENKIHDEMLYRHDTYCGTGINKSHVGDEHHTIFITFVIMKPEQDSHTDVCKHCLKEIVNQM